MAGILEGGLKLDWEKETKAVPSQFWCTGRKDPGKRKIFGGPYGFVRGGARLDWGHGGNYPRGRRGVVKTEKQSV